MLCNILPHTYQPETAQIYCHSVCGLGVSSGPHKGRSGCQLGCVLIWGLRSSSKLTGDCRVHFFEVVALRSSFPADCQLRLLSATRSLLHSLPHGPLHLHSQQWRCCCVEFLSFNTLNHFYQSRPHPF